MLPDRSLDEPPHDTDDTTRFDSLYPLSAFYKENQEHLPSYRVIRPDELPETYRAMLVHERSMTRTLEAEFQQNLELQVIKSTLVAGCLLRQILLIAPQNNATVELAFINIYLEPFSQTARDLILQGVKPLGAILREEQVQCLYTPLAYLQLVPDQLILKALGSVNCTRVFGRRVLLHNQHGNRLADVVEILP